MAQQQPQQPQRHRHLIGERIGALLAQLKVAKVAADGRAQRRQLRRRRASLARAWRRSPPTPPPPAPRPPPPRRARPPRSAPPPRCRRRPRPSQRRQGPRAALPRHSHCSCRRAVAAPVLTALAAASAAAPTAADALAATGRKEQPLRPGRASRARGGAAPRRRRRRRRWRLRRGAAGAKFDHPRVLCEFSARARRPAATRAPLGAAAGVGERDSVQLDQRRQRRQAGGRQRRRRGYLGPSLSRRESRRGGAVATAGVGRWQRGGEGLGGVDVRRAPHAGRHRRRHAVVAQPVHGVAQRPVGRSVPMQTLEGGERRGAHRRPERIRRGRPRPVGGSSGGGGG